MSLYKRAHSRFNHDEADISVLLVYTAALLGNLLVEISKNVRALVKSETSCPRLHIPEKRRPHMHNRKTYNLHYQTVQTVPTCLGQVLCIGRYLAWNNVDSCRSQWPRGLRRGSTAARLLRLWVRIPPGAWIFVCCECCVLEGRGLCDGLIIRSEESYRLWRVVVCDQETSQARRLKPTRGL